MMIREQIEAKLRAAFDPMYLDVYKRQVSWCPCSCAWAVCARVSVAIFQPCFVNLIEMLFFQFFDFCNRYVVILSLIHI